METGGMDKNTTPLLSSCLHSSLSPLTKKQLPEKFRRLSAIHLTTKIVYL
jgi:hypothetical protein